MVTADIRIPDADPKFTKERKLLWEIAHEHGFTAIKRATKSAMVGDAQGLRQLYNHLTATTKFFDVVRRELEHRALINYVPIREITEQMERNTFVATLMDFLVSEKNKAGYVSAVDLARKMDGIYPGFLKYYVERSV